MGCSKNLVDSEKLAAQLVANGYEVVFDAECTDAEIAFVNTCGFINDAKDAGHKIVSIGTTTTKALESSTYTNGHVKPYEGWTNKFIFPPYNFMVPNAMVTNFHAPQSPMLMMVAAFGGYEFIMHAYKVAVEEKYRFLTFGDAMLII